MTPPTASESRVSGLLANLGLKATALGVAVGLYAIVHGTQDAQRA